MNLVDISGPPAAGKLTVARELARLTGYKVFHNHLAINAVVPVFGFTTQTLWALVEEIWERVLERAAAEDVNVIFTHVYRHPDDFESTIRRFNLVENLGGRTCHVALTCDMAQLESRASTPERVATRKISNVEILRQRLAVPGLSSSIPGRESLVIDNTHLSPQDAAMRIIRHYGLL